MSASARSHAALERAYFHAAVELGFASAAWLFANEVHDDGGDAALTRLAEASGARFPVLDQVLRERLAGHHAPPLRDDELAAAVAPLQRLLVVGNEAALLDALTALSHHRAARANPLKLGVYAASSLGEVDWPRVRRNSGDRLELVAPERFLEWAGARSGLLTATYGHDDAGAHVVPEWSRVLGPDTRPQFRSLVGVAALRAPPQHYPRWLAHAAHDEFTQQVGAGGRDDAR